MLRCRGRGHQARPQRERERERDGTSGHPAWPQPLRTVRSSTSRRCTLYTSVWCRQFRQDRRGNPSCSPEQSQSRLRARTSLPWTETSGNVWIACLGVRAGKRPRGCVCNDVPRITVAVTAGEEEVRAWHLDQAWSLHQAPVRRSPIRDRDRLAMRLESVSRHSLQHDRSVHNGVEMLLPQWPPCPMLLPSVLYTTQRLPSSSWNPAGSMAPPMSTWHASEVFNGVYGAMTLRDVAAPTQWPSRQRTTIQRCLPSRPCDFPLAACLPTARSSVPASVHRIRARIELPSIGHQEPKHSYRYSTSRWQAGHPHPVPSRFRRHQTSPLARCKLHYRSQIRTMSHCLIGGRLGPESSP